uniref:Glycosyltransferase 2-like domain-containing protein n=1 Tax=viral metagenome TaxID=1070528 RepID=A0A6C0H546_9ZZZZ
MNFIYSTDDGNIYNTLLYHYEYKNLTVFMDNNIVKIKTILKKSLFYDEINKDDTIMFDLYISSNRLPLYEEKIKPGGMLIIKDLEEEINQNVYNKVMKMNENITILYKNMVENLKNQVFIKNNMIPENNYKMTIITPCYKLGDHLNKLKESIDFKYVDEWIIIYDCKIKDLKLSFKNSLKIKEICITKISKEDDLINKALEKVSKLNTFIYIISENGIMHKDIFRLVEFNLLEKKCYTFDQDRRKNEIILRGEINEMIEKNMILYYRNMYKEIQYRDAYEFIKSCKNKDPMNYIYINTVLSFSE